MSETFEERTDRRLTQIETTLHNIDERTQGIPALINRVLEMMGDFRNHVHNTGGPIARSRRTREPAQCLVLAEHDRRGSAPRAVPRHHHRPFLAPRPRLQAVHPRGVAPSEQEDPMTDVLAYIRVSTETQVNDGYGLDIPDHGVCQDALAELEGLSAPLIFSDEGVSGTKDQAERPGLDDLIVHCQDVPGCTVILPKLDRLARSLAIQETLLAVLSRQTGATVRCRATGERTTTSAPERIPTTRPGRSSARCSGPWPSSKARPDPSASAQELGAAARSPLSAGPAAPSPTGGKTRPSRP